MLRAVRHEKGKKIIDCPPAMKQGPISQGDNLRIESVCV